MEISQATKEDYFLDKYVATSGWDGVIIEFKNERLMMEVIRLIVELQMKFVYANDLRVVVHQRDYEALISEVWFINHQGD